MSTVADVGTGSQTATPGVASSEGAGHRPVLLHPLIESLQPRPGQVAVDGTLGARGVPRPPRTRRGRARANGAAPRRGGGPLRPPDPGGVGGAAPPPPAAPPRRAPRPGRAAPPPPLLAQAHPSRNAHLPGAADRGQQRAR